MNEQARQGITALKVGDRAAARQLLKSAVRQAPGDVQAWLWLAAALDQPREQIACLHQALRLDPGNQTVARAIAKLQGKRAPASPPEKMVFRSRPSLLPALICFWLFLVGAVGVAALLVSFPQLGLLLAGALGIILEIIVLYVVIRSLTMQYELTNQRLTLRSHGKRAWLPIGDVINADSQQTLIQRLLGIGDIEIDAVVNGQLAHLWMRNIRKSRQRAAQIMNQVRQRVSP
jgi:hypothetical protein